MKTIILIIVAYLLGSISPSIIQGKLKGIDIKKEGSGNAGSTNTLRVLGKKAALITLAVDILKGFIAVKLGAFGGMTCAYLCAIAAFLGHIYPCYYGFKGGKGVATAAGVVLAINPLIALICLVLVLIIVAITRYVSLGSISAAVLLIILCCISDRGFLPFATIIAVIVIFKHRANIDRLIHHKENKISFKK